MDWKGVKKVYGLTFGCLSQVSVLACMSAAGLYLPPLLIYPSKYVPNTENLQGFDDAVLLKSKYGWNTCEMFLSWIEAVFIPKTAHLTKPILLLVDVHVSHKDFKTFKMCQDNGIILFCIPPHSSHLLQPLNQAFFNSIKCAWKKQANWHVKQTGELVHYTTFAQVFGPVWCSQTTRMNAEASFSAAGIYPFDPQRITISEKLITSESTSAAMNNLSDSMSEPLPPIGLPDLYNEGCPAMPFLVPAISETPTQSVADQSSVFSPSSSFPTTSESTPTQVVADLLSSEFSPSSSVPATPEPNPQASSSSQAISEPLTKDYSDVSPLTPEQVLAIRDYTMLILDKLAKDSTTVFLNVIKKNLSPGNSDSRELRKFKAAVINFRNAFDCKNSAPQSRASLVIEDIKYLKNLFQNI